MKITTQNAEPHPFIPSSFPTRRPSRSGYSGSHWIFELWISSKTEISQSLQTLFQCLTTLILRKKNSILLSNWNLLCYNLCLLYTLPNRIWFLLLCDPIKFLQTGIRSLQRHLFSGPNNPCWSPSNESISTCPVPKGPHQFASKDTVESLATVKEDTICCSPVSFPVTSVQRTTRLFITHSTLAVPKHFPFLCSLEYLPEGAAP